MVNGLYENKMLTELVQAFFLIFVAEMGDKTQILAMAFATRYPVRKVLLGVFIGSLLNHGLAVFLGSFISTFVPINLIQIIAGFAFVMFSLWTLKAEEEEDEDASGKGKTGPVLTVALAFFIGELGDKTQLTAITLAVDAAYPIFILSGTVLGMLVTSGIGIFIGRKLGDKIPEFAIKIIASVVFMFFGVTKLITNVPKAYLTPINILIFILVCTVIGVSLLLPMLKLRREGRQTQYQKISKALYDYYHHISQNVEDICLGEAVCGVCEGNSCIIGYTKSLIKSGLDGEEAFIKNSFNPSAGTLNKEFNQNQLIYCLQKTLEVIHENPSDQGLELIHEIRRKLELLLFGQSIEEMPELNGYQLQLDKIDKEMAKKLFAKSIVS